MMDVSGIIKTIKSDPGAQPESNNKPLLLKKPEKLEIRARNIIQVLLQKSANLDRRWNTPREGTVFT